MIKVLDLGCSTYYSRYALLAILDQTIGLCASKMGAFQISFSVLKSATILLPTRYILTTIEGFQKG